MRGARIPSVVVTRPPTHDNEHDVGHLISDWITENQHFGYAIDTRYLPVLLPFGVRGSKDGVTLSDDGTVLDTYGFIKLQATLANVTGAHITRNYRWWTAFGARRSMARRRTQLRHESRRRSVRPLRRERFRHC